ncbi:MAG: response regulator [Nitrospirae bacterium]|nr:response regulator [Nitrospirota bacterium]
MSAICPKCQNVLQLEQIPLRKDVQMTCAVCQAALRVSLVVGLDSAPTAGAASGSRPSSPALNEKRVMAAVEGEASNEMIREVLTTEGFEWVTVGPGQDIMTRLEKERPAVLIVDVGFPEIHGFEIAELIRKRSDLKEIGVILLASIYDKTRYKREPDSLYGADDYVERHHIQDQLLSKIHRILGTRSRPIPETAPPTETVRTAAEPPPQSPIRTATATQPRSSGPSEPAMTLDGVFEDLLEKEGKTTVEKAPAEDLKKPPPKPKRVEDPAAHETAKRLARIIISDIALYNQRAIEEGIRNGTFYEVLHEEIDEGKKLYESRVPSAIVVSTDYYREAIDDFIEKRKAEMQRRA